jgi:hypothetical protein
MSLKMILIAPNDDDARSYKILRGIEGVRVEVD